MIVLQSTEDKFATKVMVGTETRYGYVNFDRVVFGVALANNYDPALAAARRGEAVRRSDPMPFDPTQHLGEAVTFRGTAHTARAGAIVMVPDSPPVYVSGLTEWADDVAGRQVEVTGRLRSRSSRVPQADAGGDQYHGVGATIALDDAQWSVLD